MNADCNSSRANYSPHVRITGLVLDFRDGGQPVRTSKKFSLLYAGPIMMVVLRGLGRDPGPLIGWGSDCLSARGMQTIKLCHRVWRRWSDLALVKCWGPGAIGATVTCELVSPIMMSSMRENTTEPWADREFQVRSSSSQST